MIRVEDRQRCAAEVHLYPNSIADLPDYGVRAAISSITSPS